MDAGQVRRFFLEAMEVDPASRVLFVERSGMPPEAQAAVLTLLRHDSTQETFFRQAVMRELPRPVGGGEQFGPYRLCELLGRGGMGSVFRAERVDGELHRVVAIKILGRGWFDASAVERFRSERQILSGLVHPNIAQLLDGGTRADGMPYLVMEYVDGLRLDHYCAQHQLSIGARLEVFLPLCDAVEFAHRKLVVHRDLKPSNVLVTAEGSPKLLDFGVAKAIDAEAGGRTLTFALTPDFASPEQLLGDEITTATDVYGLGAVLYHLLTDRPPHPVDDLSPAALRRAICEIGPARPSSLRPELNGDLENILMKALAPEPAARYGSVRELADDIRRYLAHRPVRATPYGWKYRAGRFLQRHALASIAATLAVLGIAGGVGVSLYEARRAQQRFDQVRELANHFLFDFESSIRDVPGTLEARRSMAATAGKFLENLSADAKGSPGITRELAESYYRLSRVEFNAGRSENAMNDVEKSLALFRSVRDDCCGAAEQRLLYIRALSDQARYRNDARDIAGARAISDGAVAQAREWLRSAPDLQSARLALMAALSTDGFNVQSGGDFKAARRIFEEAIFLGDRLVRDNPQDEELTYQQAKNEYLLANLGYSLQDGALTRDAAQRSREVLDRLLIKHPDNFRWQQLRVMAVSTVSSGQRLLADAGDPALGAKALESARLAYDLAKVNAERNTGDRNWADQFAVTTTALAIELRSNQRLAEALTLVREAGATMDGLVREEPKRHRYRFLAANNRVMLAEILIGLERWNDASAALREGEDLHNSVLKETPDDFYTVESKISLLADEVIVDHKLGDVTRARTICREGLALADSLIRKDPSLRSSISAMNRLHREAASLGIH